LPTGRIVNVADTTICGGSDVLLRLNLTGTGTLKVTYRENSSDIIAANTTAGRTVITRKPASSTPLDVYNYSLVKVEDGNGCIATSLTGAKKANVYKIPVAEAGPAQIVCGPKVTLSAVPSYGSGTWSFLFPSAQVVGSTTNAPGMSFTLDSTIFVNGIMTKRFYWEETNWQCKRKDSVDITFYKRPLKIFAGNDTTLFSFDGVFHLQNDPPESWETGSWTPSGNAEIIGSGNPYYVQNLSAGDNKLLWKIQNRTDVCSITDQLLINLTEGIKVAQGISPNGDNRNDTLYIYGLDLVHQDVELTILNSAGVKVFSASSYSGDTSNWRSWDGKTSSGADLPEGTYYYLLKMVSRNEGASKSASPPLKGYIVLKRR
jgi:gliding motility-associated-like protein